MRIVVLSICLLLLTPLRSVGQEIEFTDEVQTYLAHNGTLSQYEFAYDGLLKMLQNQYPETADNKKGWTYLKENKTKSVHDMILLLTPIYQKHFKRNEIKKMTNFYQSDTGKQLLNDRSKMTEVQKAELNSYYNSELGQKVIEKQTVLSQEVSKVSENWSRDLYQTAISLLK